MEVKMKQIKVKQHSNRMNENCRIQTSSVNATKKKKKDGNGKEKKMGGKGDDEKKE